MLDAKYISTLEKGLQETRKMQSALMSRLREVEFEAEHLREEIRALEKASSQTESLIDGLLVAMRGSGRSLNLISEPSKPQDLEFERSLQSSPKPPRRSSANRLAERSAGGNIAYLDTSRSVPSRTTDTEPISLRFADRTITQACTLLLREADHPLHVNELYNLLVAGGMEFKGNNPTISVAVSLNRNRRFCKVDPGTFDLVMRDASRKAS
jgi:hypothetical protein